MQDIRVTLEQLVNTNLALQLEVNNLKQVLVELATQPKIERGDKLLTATQVKQKLGVSDTKWAKVKSDPTFASTCVILTDGGHPQYSDKRIDAYIVGKTIKN